MATQPRAYLAGITSYLPDTVLSNDELAERFPDWPAAKILAKTGIRERRIAAPDETSADLAAQAAQRLFDRGDCRPDEVDFLLFCTQSPDYLLPTSACLLQHRLGIPTSAGALDFNLGCSGFVYGLSLAKALIETGQARCVLLLTGETYSKYIHPYDKTVCTLFGDGAAATLVRAAEAAPDDPPWLGPFVFGTDGAGANNLIVPAGGFRQPGEAAAADPADVRGPDNLHMNGAEIFTFTLRTVPAAVEALLARAALPPEAIAQYVFHQANRYMLEHLRTKIGIPAGRFVHAMEDCGNTVSSSIPIALERALAAGELPPGEPVMLVGFGVGYSWAAGLLRWRG